MKSKRSKYSIFNDSTKNKRRRQEQNHNLQAFDTKNFTNSEKSTFFAGKKQDYHHKNDKNNKNTYRQHATIAPYFFDESEMPSRPDFTYKKEAPRTYLYGFTDSRFIYFLGTLEPKAYLVFITLIALIITEDLNETESKIIYAFISNIADTMLTLVEQEVILNNYNRKKEFRELSNALHHDFETIYAELDKIKKKFPK